MPFSQKIQSPADQSRLRPFTRQLYAEIWESLYAVDNLQSYAKGHGWTAIATLFRSNQTKKFLRDVIDKLPSEGVSLSDL